MNKYFGVSLCRMCFEELDDSQYRFCGQECQLAYWNIIERDSYMSDENKVDETANETTPESLPAEVNPEIKDELIKEEDLVLVKEIEGNEPKNKPIISSELYLDWFQKKTLTINQIIESSKDDKDKALKLITANIERLKQIITLGQAEYGMWANGYDKILGRNGVQPSIRAAREKMITDPNFKVNTPLKEPKKSKADKLQDAGVGLGIDMKELAAQIAAMKAAKKG